MQTSTKVKMLGVAVAATGAVAGVHASPIIANDTLEGLPAAGTQMGGFLTGITPGVFAVLLLLGLAGAIVLIIVAVGDRIKGGIGGRR